MMLMMMMHFYSAFSIKSAQISFKTLCRGLQPDCIEKFTLEEIFAGALNIGIFGHKVRPQHWEMCLLLFV